MLNHIVRNLDMIFAHNLNNFVNKYMFVHLLEFFHKHILRLNNYSYIFQLYYCYYCYYCYYFCYYYCY